MCVCVCVLVWVLAHGEGMRFDSLVIPPNSQHLRARGRETELTWTDRHSACVRIVWDMQDGTMRDLKTERHP
jgi:hypothetical protein